MDLENIDVCADVKPQVGGDLLVATTAAVQFVAGVADQRGELLFDEMMDVFGFIVFKISGRVRGVLSDLRQAVENRIEFAVRQNSGQPQGASVRSTGRKFVWQENAVKRKRPLPAFEIFIERLAEPAGPHFHFATSFSLCDFWRACARERDGNPRIRMKPAASF